MQVNGFNNIVTSFYAKVSKAFLLSNAPFITACANLRQFESRIFYFYSHILFLFYPLKSGISRSKARKVLCWKAQNDGLFFLFANVLFFAFFPREKLFFLPIDARGSMSISKTIFWNFYQRFVTDSLFLFSPFVSILWFFFIC